MLNKYYCDAYDSGYCYRLGRPLTDEEDDICEEYCNAISTMSTYEQLEHIRELAEMEEIQSQIIKEEEYICSHVNEADEEYSRNHEYDYECLKDMAEKYFEKHDTNHKWILGWVRTH